MTNRLFGDWGVGAPWRASAVSLPTSIVVASGWRPSGVLQGRPDGLVDPARCSGDRPAAGDPPGPRGCQRSQAAGVEVTFAVCQGRRCTRRADRPRYPTTRHRTHKQAIEHHQQMAVDRHFPAAVMYFGDLSFRARSIGRASVARCLALLALKASL
jgi:hypothetical protein